MSTDRPPTPKRTLTIRLSARRDKDLAAALAAVVAAAPKGIGVELCPVEQPGNVAPAPPPVAKDEPLETKARELLQKLSDQAAAEADKEIATAERDAERMRAEIIAQRAGFRAYVKHWAGQGVRIAVELTEKILTPVTDAVSKVLTGVFGGKKLE
jgi:hypothetical protein